MDPSNVIIRICINAIPLILAITLHEAAHGYVAKMFGDNTAYMLGRVTLNPAKHIDPVGTIVFPLISMIVGGILFGWAKPVPVNFGNLRHPKRDMLWVAAAGPGSNVVQALLWAALAKAIEISASASGIAEFWFAVAIAGIGWNVDSYARLEPYGMPILIGLIVMMMVFPPLGHAFSGLLRTGEQFFFSLFGLQ